MDEEGGLSMGGENSDRATIAKWAENIENRTRIAIEFGLLKAKNSSQELISAIAAARRLEEEAKTGEAAGELMRAEHLLHRELYAKGRWKWRLVHFYQLPLLAYYLLALLCLLNIGSGYWGFVAAEVWGLPTAPLGMGALGAVLRGLWWLYRHVARRSFRPSFVFAHLAAPWIGALFGLLTHLLLLAGVVSLEGPGEADLSASMPLALAFLAGYSWEWVLDRLDRLRSSSATK